MVSASDDEQPVEQLEAFWPEGASVERRSSTLRRWPPRCHVRHPGRRVGTPRRQFEPVVVGEQQAQPVGLHTPGVARRRWAITALPIADGPTEPSSKIAAAQSGQTWPCTKPGPRQRSCATRPVRAPCGCPATVPVPPATAAPAATAAAAAPTTGASAAATPSPGRRNDRPQASGEPCEESPPLVGAVMRAPGQRRAADRLPRWQD